MLTIIIPIYNSERHLNQCLASVNAQTFTDFECILVDDGSSDDSPAICDHWAEKDSRFTVIHKKNEGVSAARNEGLNIAKGEHIIFVDSDDWLDEDYIAQMTNYSEGSDLTVSGQIREYDNNKRQVYLPRQTEIFSITPECTARFTYLCENWLLYAPHEKLYIREIIERNHIRFKPGCSYGEDLMFNFEYLEHVNTISTINKAFYHYRIGEDSLSSRFRPNQFDEDYEQWKILSSFFQNRNMWNEESKPYLFKRLWGIVYDGIFLYPKLEEASTSYLSHILNIPEMEGLRQFKDLFPCAPWLKWLILHRQAFTMKLILSSISNRN